MEQAGTSRIHLGVQDWLFTGNQTQDQGLDIIGFLD